MRVNSFTQAIDETLRIEGTSNDVVVKFATGQTADGTTPFASLTATGMRLDVLGASLTGDFSFAKQGDGLTITATNVAMSFGGVADGTSARGPPVSFTNGSGTFTAGATGITADFGGTLALNLPGVSTTSTFRIKVDPTSVAVSATDVTLDILGNTLTGDFSFEQSAGVTHLVIEDATLSIAGAISLKAINGELTISADGVTGRLAATVDSPRDRRARRSRASS